MYGLLSGQYRFYGDIRPEILTSLGLVNSLCCHPYDLAAGLLFKEAGCSYESLLGGEVDVPIDTVTPVSWVAFANEELATNLRSEILTLMHEYVGEKRASCDGGS
tara:strand:+ start:85 stop:399 length:315 start_codon:yes stop_codon:yes gene_type:complete